MIRPGSMWFHGSLVVVIAALTFAAGVAVGILATRSYQHAHPDPRPAVRVTATVHAIPEPTPRVRFSF